MRIDVRRLRGALASDQIGRAEFARVCGLSRQYTSAVLSGSKQPGELAEIKLRRGLRSLGIAVEDCEAAVPPRESRSTEASR